MKKVISCLVTITLLLALTPLSFAESEWYKSDDGVLEVQVVSFEEKAYPQYTLQLCFRLDGSKVSDAWNCSFNLNSVISQYAAQHPEMKNRKINISSEGNIKRFKFISGTNYEIILPVLVGKDKTVDLSIPMDAVAFFPNDFVNTDAMTAAMILDDVRGVLSDPSYFTVNDAKSFRKENEVYFVFSIKAKNRLGGITNDLLVALYEESSGKYAVYAMQAGEFYVEKGASTSKLYSNSYSYLNKYAAGAGTALSVPTILNYMN